MSLGALSNLFVVKIDGAPLTILGQAAQLDCWVESSFSLPSTFHLTYADQFHLLLSFSPQLRIGSTLSVYAVAGGQGADIPLITGLITGIETDQVAGNFSTVIRGMDHSFKMLRQRRTLAHLNMTGSDIVEYLAGLDEVEVGLIEPTTDVVELRTQANVSDWEYVQYLAEQNGMVAYFDDLGLLQFHPLEPAVSVGGLAAAMSPYVLQLGANAIRSRVSVTAAGQVSAVRSRGWDVDNKRTLVGEATAETNPDVKIGTSPGLVGGLFAPCVLVETGTPYDSVPQVRQAAKSLAADVTSSFAELEVAIKGQPLLLPGKVVTVSGAGTPFNGAYTITGTRHVFEEGSYETWVTMTGRQVRTLYGLASGGSGSAPGRQIHGVVSAIVTDIRDPRDLGRVKLRFPWLDDTYVSDWVRTVQFGGASVGATSSEDGEIPGPAIPAASPGAGGAIVPEVNDEVLVAFDRGDIDHPYVIGGLYNGRNKPSRTPDPTPEIPLITPDGTVGIRSLVSRSGQRLDLLDSVAPELKGVRLITGQGTTKIFLDDTATEITVSSDGAVSISGAKSVTISTDGKLALSGTTVEITGETSIKGATTVTGALSVTGDATVTGEASITGELVTITAPVTNVTGVLNVEGDIFMADQQVMVI